MKKVYLLVLLLVGFATRSHAQPLPCQTVVASIDATLPAMDTGWVNLCLGEEINFFASGQYPQSGQTYPQSDQLSTFTWSFGDGKAGTGQSVSHLYEAPGLYYAFLVVTDQNGCSNISLPLVKVRVAPLPVASFKASPGTQVCPGTTISLKAETDMQPLVFHGSPTLLNTNPTPIPDGDGSSIFDTITVHGYAGQTVSSGNDLENICLNMEHSWLRDLEIKLTCPNGQTAILHNHPGQIGGEMFLGIPQQTDEGFDIPIPGVGYDYCWNTDPENAQTWIQYANSHPTIGTLPAGSYMAFEPFSNFVGCPVDGHWVLEVKDNWAIDNGYLFGWSLGFGNSIQNPVSQADSFTVVSSLVGWLPSPGLNIITSDSASAVIDSNTVFQALLTNDFGCEQTLDTAITLYPNMDNCQACEDITVDAGADFTMNCFGLDTLSASISVPLGTCTIKWTTSDGALLGNPTKPVIYINAPGTYILHFNSIISNCEKQDTIVVWPHVGPMADAGQDTVLACFTESVALQGSAIGLDLSYHWEAVGSGLVADPTILGPTVFGSDSYVLEVYDASNGCSDLDTVNVVIAPSLIAAIETTDAGCNQADGTATVALLPGITNADFAWSNGASNTPTLGGLAQGWYSVTVSNMDCTVHQNFYIDEDISCKVLVGGHVLNDPANMDCLPDPATVGVECIMLHLLPTDIYTYTDSAGYYEFVADAGTYTVEYVDEDIYELLCPQDGLIAAALPVDGSISTDNDFYVKQTPIINWTVAEAHGPARPGFEYWVNLSYCNKSTITTSAVLSFQYDSLLQDINLSSIADAYNPATHTATWNLNGLPPDSCGLFSFKLAVPVTVPIGQAISFNTAVTPAVGMDNFPDDNHQDWVQTVVGSYDPNDKTSMTGDNEFGGKIFAQDSILEYLIRFQNTGNDTAFTVVVRDTLSEYLDVTTIRPGIASHDYQLQFEGNKVLIFNFQNIHLLDSATNDAASHGYISYTIKRRPDLAIGTEIRNKAAIYFDYNTPIVTNETVHILSEPTAVMDKIAAPNPLAITPNPSAGAFQVSGLMPQASVVSLLVYDAMGGEIGRFLNHETLSAGRWSQSIQLGADKPAGVYFVVLKSETTGAVLGWERAVVK